MQQERHLGPDGADPPRRDGAEERGREHDAAAEVVLGKVRLASYHNEMTLSYSGQFNKRKFIKWLIIQYYPQNLEKHTLDLFLTIQKFIIKRYRTFADP